MVAIAGEGKAHEVSREKKTPDSNARSKTLNQNQNKACLLGGGYEAAWRVYFGIRV